MMNEDRLVVGSVALKKLGFNGKYAKRKLRELKIPIVQSVRYGKGWMYFVRASDVADCAERLSLDRTRAAEKAAETKQLVLKAPSRLTERPQQFIPQARLLDALARIEAKVDRLLAMWGEEETSRVAADASVLAAVEQPTDGNSVVAGNGECA